MTKDGNVDYLKRQARRRYWLHGSMGSPMALNLRDSGVGVISVSPARAYREQALADGFTPVAIAELVVAADIIMPLLRDQAMPKIYLEGVSPHLRRDQALIFSSAYNLTFGLSKRHRSSTWGWSPRTHGAAVRDRYLSAKATPRSSPSRRMPAAARGRRSSRWRKRRAALSKSARLKRALERDRTRPVLAAGRAARTAGRDHRGGTAHETRLPARSRVHRRCISRAKRPRYLRAAAGQGLLKALDSQSLTAQYPVSSAFTNASMI
ncbi:MAG: hypothetical protein IPK17_30380 [Chloroflexi bacterium]|nr:hypothetical protein [Chloroflexota bacterium]